MAEFKKIEFTGDDKEKYWNGPQNSLVRYYAYASRGITLLNEFKYYAALIFGAYLTAGATTIAGVRINPLWVLVAGVVGLPCIILLGRWHLYRAQKTIEWVTTHHGSITQFNAYNMQVKNLEQQEELIRLLKEINRKLDKA